MRIVLLNLEGMALLNNGNFDCFSLQLLSTVCIYGVILKSKTKVLVEEMLQFLYFFRGHQFGTFENSHPAYLKLGSDRSIQPSL